MSMTLRKWIFSAACCLFLASVAEGRDDASEIYKWVDEDGNVHFSDCPPPPSCDAEALRLPAEPDPEDVRLAQEQLDALLQQQQESREERKQEKLAQERRKVLAMQAALARKQVCLRARQNLHVLEKRRPVYYINEDGEYVYLDDAARLAEVHRMQRLIRENCEAAPD